MNDYIVCSYGVVNYGYAILSACLDVDRDVIVPQGDVNIS